MNDDATAIEPARRGHELRDVRIRPIVLAALALMLMVGLAGAGMRALLGYLTMREARRSAVVSPLAVAAGRHAPPEPRLQTAPIRELQELRAEEEAMLDSYGWVDRDAGIVRIPIDRAMDLLAESESAGNDHAGSK